MRYAMANGGPEDGVKLYDGQRTPFPDGAISPILNWDSIILVPEKYRVVRNNEVKEMTAEEKRVVDNNMLSTLKKEKNAAIDNRTSQLIDAGYEYPADSGNTFSMSLAAQKNIMAYKQVIDIGAATYPLKMTFTDPDGLDDEYDFEDADAFNVFYAGAFMFVQTQYNSGRALKLEVKNASDIDELNAVIDNR